MKKVGEKLVPKTKDKFDAKDIKKVENYAKAINMPYCAVNPDDYRKISCCTTAKEMWDKLEVTYEGTDQTYANKDLVRKILRSLTPEWRSKADAIYESIGVSNVTIDGLRGNLKTYESTILTPSLDEQKKKGIALKATKETIEEVSSDDDNEFGLVIKKFHKFMKKEFERKGRKHDGPPKCYGCGEIGHIKPRCPKGKSGTDKPGFKKQRAYISWGGDSDDESTDQEEEEAANLCLMAHEDHTDEIQEEGLGFGKNESKDKNVEQTPRQPPKAQPPRTPQQNCASIATEWSLPYAFLVMDLIVSADIHIVGPSTKITKLWVIADTTFKKKSGDQDDAGPSRARARAPAPAPARASLQSIADTLNRLTLTVDNMGQMDWRLQRQHHDMTAFFRGINYVPPPFDSTILGQNFEGEDEDDDSYAPSSSPDEADFEDAVDGDPMDVENNEDEDADA
ncbi:unnamed protein product [Cuscuta campestris]|uniref:CCHC-type domain-containing protein n=1 Tax=Cuscuta campestris TaxID=132261 RepID=A0A484LN52_9ASTE|nr:unnamed protein product [Cuscuta campestris]